jgi:ATP synthase protein I
MEFLSRGAADAWLDGAKAGNYVARDLKRANGGLPAGREYAMAGSDGPGETGGTGSGGRRAASGDEDLERRRRDLEAALAATRSEGRRAEQGAERGGVAGYGQAFKLSSEFIAGIAAGAGLGWVIDAFVGTSPWGLIVFLLLGFGAGVLNVLRSAGMVAQTGPRPPGEGDREADRE